MSLRGNCYVRQLNAHMTHRICVLNLLSRFCLGVSHGNLQVLDLQESLGGRRPTTAMQRTSRRPGLIVATAQELTLCYSNIGINWLPSDCARLPVQSKFRMSAYQNLVKMAET